MTAAVFVPAAVKVMVSVHIDSPLLLGQLSIYLNRIGRSSVFRYV
jgi:flagellar biosynthesis protein FliQ